MGFELIPHKNGDDWRRSIVRRIVAQLREDLKTSERPVVLSLAGGSTPNALYADLATHTDLDWSRIVVMPGDDRCVPHAHESSNVRALREVFAPAIANGLTVAPLTADDESCSMDTGESMMATYPMHFSVSVLGMGNDMHTASLFPNSASLALGVDPQSLSDVVTVIPDPLPPEAPFPRISMTSQRLLRSRLVMVAIKGESKRDALHRALDLKDPMQAPIMAILGDDAHTTEIHWCP